MGAFIIFLTLFFIQSGLQVGGEFEWFGFHLTLTSGFFGLLQKTAYATLLLTLLTVISVFFGQFVINLFAGLSGSVKGLSGSVNKSSSLVSGKVKWFKKDKGFGFIEMEDGTDIFVHFKSINVEGHKTLFKGQEVTFEVTQGEKGPQAENVTPL